MSSRKLFSIQLDVLDTLTEFATSKEIYKELESKRLLSGIVDWITAIKAATKGMHSSKTQASIKEHLKLIMNVLSTIVAKRVVDKTWSFEEKVGLGGRSKVVSSCSSPAREFSTRSR
eukprot:TRINITY_DN10750_c0_g1_i1.p1 TRINITY_DN10750_c0_g1~~TRINITY_DN10750_c0_g1_i1.p1  ORF type:complete len:117 (-),score=22.28 TRINITY_DN10750_c0_g1_i1:499-849(-)